MQKSKLITYEQFKKKRELKPLPVINFNEKRDAEIFPFSKGIVARKNKQARREKLRVQQKELRKTLLYIGLPFEDEFIMFVICYWRDQEEIKLLAKVDQYRHLRNYLIEAGQSIMPKYRKFAIAMGQLGIFVPNFSWEMFPAENTLLPTNSKEPPDEIA